MLATFTASGINYQILVTLPGRREAERYLEDILPEKRAPGSSWRTRKERSLARDRRRLRHYDPEPEEEE